MSFFDDSWGQYTNEASDIYAISIGLSCGRMLSQTPFSADAEPRSPVSKIDYFLSFCPQALEVRYANSLYYRVRLLSVVVEQLPKEQRSRRIISRANPLYTLNKSPRTSIDNSTTRNPPQKKPLWK